MVFGNSLESDSLKAMRAACAVAARTILSAALMAASASAQNLVTNPGFETPQVSSWTSYSAGSTALAGWTVDTTPSDGVQLFAAGNAVNDGSQTLQLTDAYSVGGGIRQTIATHAGTQYNVSIDVASRGSKATAYGYFNFGGQVRRLSATSATFTTVSWQVTATSASTLIDIYGTNRAGTYQLVIDNVSVTPPAGPVNVSNSTVALSTSWIPGNGTTSASVTVALKDSSGNPVANKTVSLSSARGAADSISPVSGTSSAAGIVTFTVTSASPGLAVLSATDVTDSLALSNASLTVLTADAHGPQAAPDPMVFDQTATNDNLIVLKAAAAEYSSRLTLIYSGPSHYPGHFWFNNWNNGTNDYMKWNVALQIGATYHVYAKLSAGANVPLQLSITGTNTVLNCTTRNNGWCN
jgi:hypothetical protein